MRLRTATTTAAVAVVLALLPVGTSATPLDDPPPPAGPSPGQGTDHRSARAEAALDKALALFDGRAGAARQRDRRTRVAPTEHASAVLRELAVRVDDLDPADRETALAVLARPTDTAKDGWPGVKYAGASSSTCDEPGSEASAVCVHWVSTTRDAPPLADTNGDGVPDQVEVTVETLGEVRDVIHGGLGYRRPLVDAAGPGPGVDVYLAELGRYGVFGYCVPEPDGTTRRAPAYCVLDDDFVEFEGDPLEDLQVTAAHEYFHVVQMAFSAYSQMWVYESTAAWVEDEVYDDVNGNLAFLLSSPLTEPWRPLDAFDYGGWVWWRYLAERYGARGTSDPSVVRNTWVRIGKGVAPLAAVQREISARGGTFNRVFADFAATNRFAKTWYDEGRSYPNAQVMGTLRVTGARRSTGWRYTRVDHLASQSIMVRPGRGLAGRWRLRIELDLPPRLRGSQATVVVHRRDGTRRWYRPGLDRRGDAVLSVPFDSRSVSGAALTFTNAGKGDGRAFAFRATAVRR